MMTFLVIIHFGKLGQLTPLHHQTPTTSIEYTAEAIHVYDVHQPLDYILGEVEDDLRNITLRPGKRV